MDIRFYHKSRPYSPNPCSLGNGGCSHLCLLAPNYEALPDAAPTPYSCACPTGLTLGADGKECNTEMTRCLLVRATSLLMRATSSPMHAISEYYRRHYCNEQLLFIFLEENLCEHFGDFHCNCFLSILDLILLENTFSSLFISIFRTWRFLVVARRTDIRVISLDVPYSADVKLPIDTFMTNVVDVAVDPLTGTTLQGLISCQTLKREKDPLELCYCYTCVICLKKLMTAAVYCVY